MNDTPPPMDPDEAWAAVLRRDRAYDGRFVTGVLSTNIYCRPSCAARHPSRANVQFFPGGTQARAAGLRACRRCLPDDIARDAAAIAQALETVRTAEHAPKLAELAGAANYSPSHFQRVFTRAVGLSPAAYFRALRRERAGDALTRETSVTEAIYAAGYSAPSRFYADRKDRNGMAPSAWQKGGRGVTIRWAQVDTTLGKMLVAATDKGVCRLSFDETHEELAARFPEAELAEGDEAFRELVEQVVRAIDQPETAPDVPLDVKGTAFQERVWQALRAIPPGETRTYAQIAAAAGNPAAVRAAGSANGANPVAVLVPCHRVIRTDGTLGGYAYGTEIKRRLLERERR